MTTRELKERGAQAHGKRQYRRALAAYEELRGRAPDDPSFAHRAGELLLKLGKRREAVHALIDAARLYADRKLGAKAGAVWRMVLQIDPENAEARALAAVASGSDRG